MASDYEGYFEGQNLRCYRRSRGSSSAIVTFDHWRRDRASFPSIKQGGAFLDRGFDFFRVDTCKNDWFLNSDLTPALEATSAFLESYSQVIYLGFSMGCFGLLLLANRRQPDTIIATSPAYPPKHHQYTPDRYYVPEKAVLTSCTAFVHYDSYNGVDEIEARRFSASLGGANMINLIGGGHPATNKIVENGRYRELLDYWLLHRLDAASILELHN